MSDFKRYPSIENYWNMDKLIEKYVPEFDHDKVYEWRVSEKLHGANVCVCLDKNGNHSFYSRNGHELKRAHLEFLESLDFSAYYCLTYPNDCSAYLYGELIGPGIQKGVNYGDNLQFYVFDAMYEPLTDRTQWVSFEGLSNDGNYHMPYKFEIESTYKDLIDIVTGYLKNDPVTKINPIEGNIVEGFVATCKNMTYLFGHQRFNFKIKHPGFDERKKKSAL